ncbi:MAG: glycosyltransferase family 4 protein [Deltaproteobacteria bacterium]|nr:glycosyltransferase family 4 protein [Deltaproteobacteria bacterium]
MAAIGQRTYKSMQILCITGHSDRPEAETFIGLKKTGGFNMHILCPESAPHFKRLIDAGVQVTPFELKKRIDLNGIRKIRAVILKNKIDILHLFNNKAASNGILASINLPVKIIAYRGIVANVSFFNPMSWMTYLNPKVNRIICVAEAVRRYFLKMRLLWHQIPRNKPVTIYKGHSLDWYQDDPSDLKEFGIPKHAFVVGCTANIRPRKGIHVLIEAADHLPSNLPIHFLLVGHMTSSKLLKQIQNSKYKNQIHLTGFRSDAPALQAACNTAVLPALRREGLPKVIIEAMAYGVAPVVTNSGGSPELIENNKSGLIVPPGDAKAIAGAILSLFKDPVLCKNLGENAKSRIASCFRIEDTVLKTGKLYKTLLIS